MDLTLFIQIATVSLAAGVGGGLLAGLLGAGGGIIIVPALYVSLSATGMDPALTMQVAVGTSLLTIVFTAITSTRAHNAKGGVDWDLLRTWAPAIVIGVIIGGLLGGLLSGYLMIAVFAVVATWIGLDMILRTPTDGAAARQFSRPVWSAMGVGAGVISALMGIGGATVSVPAFQMAGIPIRRAVGTSAANGFFIGLVGALIYVITGIGVEGRPPFSLGYVNLLAGALIIPLTMIFAPIGAKLAHRISPTTLRRLFGTFVLLTAVRMWRDLAGLVW